MSEQNPKYDVLPNMPVQKITVPGNVPQIFDVPFKQQLCEMFNCNKLSRYLIGKREPSDMWRNCLNVCEDCAKSIVATIPEELKPYFVPPEGYVLVGVHAEEESAEAIEGLKEQIGHLKVQLEDSQKEKAQLIDTIEALQKQIAATETVTPEEFNAFKSNYQSNRPKPYTHKGAGQQNSQKR